MIDKLKESIKWDYIKKITKQYVTKISNKKLIFKCKKSKLEKENHGREGRKEIEISIYSGFHFLNFHWTLLVTYITCLWRFFY